MKKIRYGVAMSLDGMIAGPNGEADWIVADPEVNFAEIWSRFDTLLMGRRTFEAAVARLGGKSMDGRKVVVISSTMKPADYPKLTILPALEREKMDALRAVTGKEKSSKDIWLMGGGVLFRSLLDMGLVDMVEVSIMPVVLGKGIPLLPPPAHQARLKLVSHKIYRSGIVSLAYDVQR
jgi:dihydrofolate reductase